MSKIVQLKKEGINEYPITMPEAVIGSDGITVKDKIKTLERKINNLTPGEGGSYETPDWNASESEAGYIKNRTHMASFTRIEYDQENNKGKYEVAGFEDKLLLLWRDKYFTVYKNITLSIDVYDGEDTFIINYNGTTLFITDSNGNLKYEYKYMSVSETNVPLAEAFIPDTVIKTTPQELSNKDKNQALANLGIDPVVWKYMCSPIILINNYPIPLELIDENTVTFKYKFPGIYKLKIYDNTTGEFNIYNCTHYDDEYGLYAHIGYEQNYNIYIEKNIEWDIEMEEAYKYIVKVHNDI